MTSDTPYLWYGVPYTTFNLLTFISQALKFPGSCDVDTERKYMSTTLHFFLKISFKDVLMGPSSSSVALHCPLQYLFGNAVITSVLPPVSFLLGF